MKFKILILLSLVLTLNARYTTSKYDSLFIQASASFHNHQKYVEPARQKIIDTGEDIIPFLVSKCSSRQPREYHALRNLFGRIDPEISADELKMEISKLDKKTFGAAVEFLGRSGYEKGLEFLIPFLDNDSSWVKISAMKGIGDLKDPEALETTVKFSADPDLKMRWKSVACLGKMNSAEADAELVKMLNDPYQIVSHTALRYLDLHLKRDTLKQRQHILKSSTASSLFTLLKEKHMNNKNTELLTKSLFKHEFADTVSEYSMDMMASENSPVYSALKELYMDKEDLFFPVKTDKELFLFPTIAKMFKDPLIQASLPANERKAYDTFPQMNMSFPAEEFDAEIKKTDRKSVSPGKFLEIHEKTAALSDKLWRNASDPNTLVKTVKERFFSTEENENKDLPDDDISVMIRSRLDERKYYEESKKFYKETLKDIQPRFMIEAGINSYSDFLALIEFVKENELKPFEKDTPFGKIKVGTDGDDVYRGSYFLIIDKGGNDTYRLNNKDQRFSYIIDLEGNDRYISAQFGPASAFNGISFLYDAKGDDIYDCKDYSLASSLFAFTVLLDEAGNDRYISNNHSQAAATFGYSCLWDKSGNDVYIGEMKAQAYSGVYGYAVLCDDSGNDNYTLSGNQVDVLRYSDHFMSMGQGYSFGDRDHAGGGYAFLFDNQGNDNYISDIFGQGGAYWFAFGSLFDSAGNDNYISYQYSMGSGVHLAFGTLIDLEGDDSYKSKGVSIGCGHDYAGGMFFDLKGNDSYHAESLSIGSGNADALSIFFDGAGNDLYSAHLTSTMGWSDWRRDAGYISIFLDMSGKDKYGTHAGSNGKKWYQSTWGVGLDFDK